MPIELKKFKSRKEWLKARADTIGGSDASSVMNMCKYRDNVTLWKILCGYEKPEDISDRPYVRYGVALEPTMRKIFALHHPEWEIKYFANNMIVNSKYPFAHASLDGWIKDENGRMGILEIKTTEITSKVKAQEWAENHIPDQYYCQLLHYFLVTEYEFAVLTAEIKVHKSDGSSEWRIAERHIERSEVIQDIKVLERAERAFYKHVVDKTQPALQLPPI